MREHAQCTGATQAVSWPKLWSVVQSGLFVSAEVWWNVELPWRRFGNIRVNEVGMEAEETGEFRRASGRWYRELSHVAALLEVLK